MFEIVAQNLISLCILIIAGYIAGKAGVIDERTSPVLSDVLLKIALPCTIIMSMQKPFTTELLVDGAVVFFVSAAIYIFTFFVGAAACMLLKIKPPDEGVWIFAVMFPNVGYMGYPVLNAVYGADILFFVSMNNIVFNVLSSTIGIMIVRRGLRFYKRGGIEAKKGSRGDVNLLPIATGIGFVMFLLSYSLPEPVKNAFTMGGNMTTPLSMVIIGGLLSRGKLMRVFAFGKEYAVVALRLVVVPVLVFFAVSPFIKGEFALGTLVMLSAMPVSAVTAIFTAKYTDNAFAGSKFVALSTVLSLITLPVISMLL